MGLIKKGLHAIHGKSGSSSKGVQSSNAKRDYMQEFKAFVTSPKGIITIIAIAILVHYAYKGYKTGHAKS